MELNDLIGKNFKYISKYGDKKECDWIGTVENCIIIQECRGSKWEMFKPVIKIKSVAGPVYELNELIFFTFKPKVDTHLSTENKNNLLIIK